VFTEFPCRCNRRYDISVKPLASDKNKLPAETDMSYFSTVSRLGVGRSFISSQWAAGDFTQEKVPECKSYDPVQSSALESEYDEIYVRGAVYINSGGKIAVTSKFCTVFPRCGTSFTSSFWLLEI